MLISDVDVLRIEPSVFVDAAAVATTLLTATDGAISGTTLTSAGSAFDAAGVEAGHVVVLASEAIEVDARTNATTLEVSRPRMSSSEAKIPPDPGTGLSITVRTFERLIDRAQAAVLAELDIDANHPDEPLDETAIVNTDQVGRVIALRVAASAFAAAAALDPASDSLAARATLFASRAEQEARRVTAWIDLDGDGLADASRPLRIINLSRA